MASDTEIDDLLAIVARGEMPGSTVYGYDRVQGSAQLVLETMLARFRAPAGEVFRVQTRHAAGQFELIIAEAAWKPFGTADGFLPIIVGRDATRLCVVGHVLPFDDIMHLFTSDDMEHIRSLGSFWIEWLERPGHPWSMNHNKE